jgi:hypothetical protein
LRSAFDALCRWGIRRTVGAAPQAETPHDGVAAGNRQNWNVESGINVDGLLTILVPGTDWQSFGGWTPDSNGLFRCGDDARCGGGAPQCTKLLAWSPSGNNDADRMAGAAMLRAMIAAHSFQPGSRLHVITHSHGGNVALAASRLGLTHAIDCLIALNKPRMDDALYLPAENIAEFYNIATTGWDWIQLGGSSAWSHYKTDPHAVNKLFDTSGSKLKAHAALVWDDRFREMWWQWFLEQRG